MSDFVEQLREVAAASLLPEDGELTAPGSRRAGRGPPRPMGRAVHQRRVARRPVVRAGVRHGRRAPVPDRPAAPRRERAPVRGLRRPDARGRPVRADDRLPPHRRDARRGMGRRLDGDARPVPRGVRGVDRADAGAPGRVLAAGHGPERPHRRCGRVGGGVRVPGVGALRQLGQGAAPHARSANGWDPTPSARSCRRSRPTCRTSRRARSAARLLDDLPRPKGEGSNDWVVSGARPTTGKPLARERPAPARDPARRVDRDAPPRSGVRGARRGAHVLARRSCSARPRTTRGASRTSRATCRTSTSSA